MFDRTVLTRGNLFKDRPDIIDAISQPERWRDSMIIAYAHSLKGHLSDLSDIFKLENDKAKY